MEHKIIKSVRFDEEKRILIVAEAGYESYLQREDNKQLIKKAAMGILKTDFIKLEIGKNIARITVAQGTEERSIEKIKSELVKNLEFALMFLKK